MGQRPRTPPALHRWRCFLAFQSWAWDSEGTVTRGRLLVTWLLSVVLALSILWRKIPQSPLLFRLGRAFGRHECWLTNASCFAVSDYCKCSHVGKFVQLVTRSTFFGGILHFIKRSDSEPPQAHFGLSSNLFLHKIARVDLLNSHLSFFHEIVIWVVTKTAVDWFSTGDHIARFSGSPFCQSNSSPGCGQGWHTWWVNWSTYQADCRIGLVRPVATGVLIHFWFLWWSTKKSFEHWSDWWFFPFRMGNQWKSTWNGEYFFGTCFLFRVFLDRQSK